jgi:hypothetical protein
VRRIEAETLLKLAQDAVAITSRLTLRARDLVNVGYGVYDALLSTDARFLKRAARGVGDPQILIENPLSSMRRHGL